MLLQYLNAVLDSGTLLFSFNTVILITIETYNYFHNCDKLNKKNLSLFYSKEVQTERKLNENFYSLV